jgi:hypothetical protein
MPRQPDAHMRFLSRNTEYGFSLSDDLTAETLVYHWRATKKAAMGFEEEAILDLITTILRREKARARRVVNALMLSGKIDGPRADVEEVAARIIEQYKLQL